MVFATLNAAGYPTGFYPEEVFPPQSDGGSNPAIPDSAIALTDDDYRALRDACGLKVFVDGEVRNAPPPPAMPASAPDGPTLGDWRVGLLLWDRLDDVNAKINSLCAAGEPMGFVAKERFDYSNNVFRKELLQLRAVLGFTADEVEESLWRAYNVSQGDLSGILI